jgi:uncharacterized protein
VDSPDPAGNDLPARLRLALRAAMKARDTAAVSVLRSALSALSNAEAVDNAEAADPDPAAEGGSPHIAGAVAGLGAGEVQRRHLTEAQVSQILQAEITDRHRAAREYDEAGHPDWAGRLRHEAAVLQSVRSPEAPR